MIANTRRGRKTTEAGEVRNRRYRLPPCTRDYSEEMAEYIEKCLSGEFPTGRLVNLAIRRHQMDLERGESRGLMWDQEAANRACAFYPLLRHSKGQYAGDPFNLRLFQVFITSSLHGWRMEDGSRRFRQAFISLGKGNGKSPYAAGQCIYTTYCEGEERADSFCYGTKRANAFNVFDEVLHQLGSMENGPAWTWYKGKYKIDGPQDSQFRAMGNDHFDDGAIPTCIVRDEIHMWREQHREIFEGVTASIDKGYQPLAIDITTAGTNESEIYIELLSDFTTILEQVDDPPADEEWFGDDQFGYIASLDEADDILDEANLPKANPMLCEPDSPVRLDRIRKKINKAKRGSETAKRSLKRYNCNLQVESLSQPIQAADWAACAGELPENLAELECWGGIDMARSRDFSAVSLVFDLGGGLKGIKSWAWTCEERSEDLEKSERFQRVLRQGNIFVHPGRTIVFRKIREFVAELHEQYGPQSWAYDKSFATETIQWLEDRHDVSCVACAQTAAAYNEPLTDFLNAIESGGLRHGGDPLLGWCAKNLVVRTDAEDRRRPDKEKSVSKIDPIVAAVMAWRESMFGDSDGPSYYEENELEVW